MIIEYVTEELEPVTQDALAAARNGNRTQAQHEACAAMIPGLWQLEVCRPTDVTAVPDRLHVAAWNIERCFHIADSRALLDQMGADLVLLTEVDQGMARTGNLHTMAELVRDTGAGFIYGVEFVEAGRGSPREVGLNPDLENAASFHGNAILSRLRLADPFLVRLDDGGVWYHGKSGDRERRIGYRNAVVARVADAQEPIWIASVHLESSSDAADRAAQTKKLIAAINARAGDDAVILGGDFNTKTLRSVSGDIADLLPEIEAREPLFAVLREAGFVCSGLNDTAVTQRQRPDGEPRPPFARLDWLFSRGISGAEAVTIAAVDGSGRAISDHDAITATFRH